MILSPQLSYLGHLPIVVTGRFRFRVRSSAQLLVCPFLRGWLSVGLAFIQRIIAIFVSAMLVVIGFGFTNLGLFRKIVLLLSSPIPWISTAIDVPPIRTFIGSILLLFLAIFFRLRVQVQLFHKLFDILLFFEWPIQLLLSGLWESLGWINSCTPQISIKLNFFPLQFISIFLFFLFRATHTSLSNEQVPYLSFHFPALKTYIWW